jgi:hypothetical protein
MLAIDIGDKSQQCDPVTVLAVQPGATVTVANSSNSTTAVSYFTNWYSSAAGTIAAGASQSFTGSNQAGPVYLTAHQGRASIQVTGTGF